VLLEVARGSQSHSVRRAALGALRRFDIPDIGPQIIELYEKLPTDQRVRETAVDVLSSRRDWALALVSAVDRGDIHRSAVAADVRQRLLLHEDEQIIALVSKLWGRTRPTPQEFHDRVAQVADVLARGDGDPLPGRELYTQHCAKCHKLHGQGEELGPDLTGYERDNLDYMLLSIVDPSAAIREEFTSFQLVTIDGLVLTGFVTQRGDQTVTLATAEKGEIVIPKDEIDEGPTAMSTSLMPDRLLDELSDQQIRDLFAYLRSPAGSAP
jgi:putative heme-binding domain-containing protein